jgi:hypothetical protein
MNALFSTRNMENRAFITCVFSFSFGAADVGMQGGCELGDHLRMAGDARRAAMPYSRAHGVMVISGTPAFCCYRS